MVPDGIHAGQPLRLRPWQKKILRSIYGSPTRRVIISYGRKNGKTAFAALLLLLHLCGPEARRNSELFSTAMSRDQAAIVFGLAAKMVRLSETLSNVLVIRDTVKQIYCPELGTLYRALSAEAKVAYGYSPALIVHDELGQVPGPRHALYEAMETATAAQADPLTVVISTQASTDAALLSALIDDAKRGHDPRTKLFLWTADETLDPFSVKAIRAANPAFGDFQRRDEILDMAAAARRMPAREAEYRNLVLNQRIEATAPYISAAVWKANAAPPESWTNLYAGLDLSSVNDLTAFVIVAHDRGEFHVWPTFWLPAEGLEEAARRDHEPYDLWRDRGYLQTTPGKAIEYEYVAEQIARVLQDRDVRRIAFDRWGMRYLRPWLIRAGIPEPVIDDRFVAFGQGWQSMTPALRALEAALLESRVRHGGHPVLTMCASNAIPKVDQAGSRKLDRKKSRGRIDGMVALAMAVSVATEDAARRLVYPVPLEEVVE